MHEAGGGEPPEFENRRLDVRPRVNPRFSGERIVDGLQVPAGVPAVINQPAALFEQMRRRELVTLKRYGIGGAGILSDGAIPNAAERRRERVLGKHGRGSAEQRDSLGSEHVGEGENTAARERFRAQASAVMPDESSEP